MITLDDQNQTCRACGTCCHMEIPVTLLDVDRLALFNNIDAQQMFEKMIGAGISEATGLFMIRKQAGRRCVFLSFANQCTVHKAKPDTCRFYSCDTDSPGKQIARAPGGDSGGREKDFWIQSVAATVTRTYIDRHHTAWHDADFHRSLENIYKNIPLRKTQTLKLGRNENGHAVSMVYDCSRCNKRGTQAKETPVTVNDIRRIADFLDLSHDLFFKQYIAEHPSYLTGGLKLKRKAHCVFFDPEHHCRVKSVRPLHCRFTPCPKQTKNPADASSLFLGTGSMADQLRHQVALTVTREYTARWGTAYHKTPFQQALQQFSGLVRDKSVRHQLCGQIAPFRYIDDTPHLTHLLPNPEDRL